MKLIRLSQFGWVPMFESTINDFIIQEILKFRNFEKATKIEKISYLFKITWLVMSKIVGYSEYLKFNNTYANFLRNCGSKLQPTRLIQNTVFS